MYHLSDGRTHTLSDSLADAFEPFEGYIVVLHDVPLSTWRVKAPNADEAIRIAHGVYQHETGKQISNAATVQRIA